MNEYTDLARLLVLPVFFWAAYQDYRSRRVMDFVWVVISGIGVILILADYFVYRSEIQLWLSIMFLLSVVVVGGVGFVFARLGYFGWADAGAFISIAVLYPIFPEYFFLGGRFPQYTSDTSIFPVVIMLNITFIAMLSSGYLLMLDLKNRSLEFPMSFVSMKLSRQKHCLLSHITDSHGRIMYSERGNWVLGADLDVVRMYLYWRYCRPYTLYESSDVCRNPASIQAVNLDVYDEDGYDGREISGDQFDEYVDLSCYPGGDVDDPWGVDMFYSQFDTDPYGVKKQQLRTTLDELFTTETPLRLRVGLPFLVFVSIGLIFSLLFGNILFLAI